MSVVGINKISQYPSIIAQWLGKSDFKLYTSHCFHRTAASLLADSGCSLPLMKIAGNWKSSTVCERYIAESSLTKRKIGEQLGLNDDQKENSPPQKAPKTNPDIVSGQQLVLHNPVNCVFNFGTVQTTIPTQKSVDQVSKSESITKKGSPLVIKISQLRAKIQQSRGF